MMFNHTLNKQYLFLVLIAVTVISLAGVYLYVVSGYKPYQELGIKFDGDGSIKIDIAETDHVRGDEDVPITLIEFGDYQCPASRQFHPVLGKLMLNYPHKIRWVYKHFPINSLHPYAWQAAEATECAGAQDKFWEYSDALFLNQPLINTDFFSSLARDLGLNVEEFKSCFESHEYRDKVNNDYRTGFNLGITGTPGNVINGHFISGAPTYEQMVEIIEELL